MKIDIKTQQEKPVHNYNLDMEPLDTSSEIELSMYNTFTCHHCNEVFASERNADLHTEFYHDEEKSENIPLLEDFKCNSCTKVFSTKDSLLNHEKSLHTDVELNKNQTKNSNIEVQIEVIEGILEEIVDQETEVDLSKETEVNVSKETEVDLNKNQTQNSNKEVQIEVVERILEEIVDQNPEALDMSDVSIV